MNNTIRIGMLFSLIVLTLLIIFLQRKEPARISGCRGDKIDMSKMLQYGEPVRNIKLADKNGRVFDLNEYHHQPLLLVFVGGKLKNIKVYDDSLRKHIGDYLDRGLNLVYIYRENVQNRLKVTQSLNMDMYYDDDSLSLFTAFRVYDHYSCIILNREHHVVLSTIVVLAPREIAKIIEYKQSDIF